MKIFNAKPITQIKQEKSEEIPPSVLEVYEIVAAMGEEIATVTAANEALKAEIEALKGGAK
ncbi:hypothetical protein NE686_13285 [Tissierella carlieri]|uniref:Uncharacterized protein n=1 Tax=Tissierella carlieri TaxID=689904 RepID=A0ABT1SC57_9FIRM|nr:hypothetical protein [Tissierella carlieri]MCQ4924069.1 hypothetical protein [Tissierella carlieri]